MEKFEITLDPKYDISSRLDERLGIPFKRMVFLSELAQELVSALRDIGLVLKEVSKQAETLEELTFLTYVVGHIIGRNNTGTRSLPREIAKFKRQVEEFRDKEKDPDDWINNLMKESFKINGKPGEDKKDG
jgi:hypothetical protein